MLKVFLKYQWAPQVLKYLIPVYCLEKKKDLSSESDDDDNNEEDVDEEDVDEEDVDEAENLMNDGDKIDEVMVSIF